QRLPNGQMNGIPAFDASWKDVVGTLYHNLNEFRTDADVGDAIETNENRFLGWMSAQGQEIADHPIAVAESQSLVFKEVLSSTGGKRLPVQLLYSNAVHGAEGPIDHPRGDWVPELGQKWVSLSSLTCAAEWPRRGSSAR